MVQMSNSRFTVLMDVLPNLLAFLWQSPENKAAVARLEHDLEEFNRQLAKAQKYLLITDANQNYVAARATDALDAVAPIISPRSSLLSAKASIDELNDILRRADDLSAYANLNPTGIRALWHPGRFALGIECDGRTYHSSRAARDRDRLREKVLMERGWKLHRIWSTDWFVNPKLAKSKLIDAVNAACK